MILSWIATAVAFLIGDQLLSGVYVGGIVSALIAAAVLGFVNMTIKPILWILTLPITLITFGLFLLVVNAMMLGLVSWIMPGFEIRSLGSGVALVIIIAVVNCVAEAVFGKEKDKDREVRVRD
jgi:putative membrane protein